MHIWYWCMPACSLTLALCTQVWVSCRGKAKEQDADFVQHCAGTVRMHGVCVCSTRQVSAADGVTARSAGQPITHSLPACLPAHTLLHAGSSAPSLAACCPTRTTTSPSWTHSMSTQTCPRRQ